MSPFLKHLFLLVFFAILTFPAYKALRHPYMISAHDSIAAVFKSIEMKSAISDGHFPVRWAKRINFGLGMPTFTFTYHVPYYLAVLWQSLGFSAVSSVKLIAAISFPLSAYWMYLWLRRHFSLPAALSGALLYTFVPYHFLNVYVRLAIGEITAATLIPLTLLLIDKFIDLPNSRNLGFLILLLGIFILSHNFYALFFILIWPIYGWIISYKYHKNFRQLLPLLILAIVGGVGVASYYLFPAVAYRKYTYLPYLANYFASHNNYLSFSDLVLPRWGYDNFDFYQPDKRMSLQIGVLHLIFFVLSVVLLSKKDSNKSRRLIIFFVLLTSISVFMTTSYSQLIWQKITVLQNLQFPWRLLAVINFTTSFCAAWTINYIKRFKLILVFLVLYPLILILNKNYWNVGRYDAWKDLTEKAIGWPGTLTMQLEEEPRWHNVRQEPQVYTYSQAASVKTKLVSKVWKTGYHKFEVDSPEDTYFSDKTDYWPGWKAYIDGQEVSLLDPYNSLSQGLITMYLPAGKHIVETRLTEPGLNKVGNVITIFSTLFALGLIFSQYIKPAHLKSISHHLQRLLPNI